MSLATDWTLVARLDIDQFRTTSVRAAPCGRPNVVHDPQIGHCSPDWTLTNVIRVQSLASLARRGAIHCALMPLIPNPNKILDIHPNFCYIIIVTVVTVTTVTIMLRPLRAIKRPNASIAPDIKKGFPMPQDISNTNIPHYKTLLTDLMEIKSSIETKTFKKLSRLLLEGYWNMGKRICQDEIFSNPKNKKQATSTLKDLSNDLNIEYSLLTRISKFYRLWPDNCPSEEESLVNWGHYRHLMAIDDLDQRQFYIENTQKKKWSTLELAHRVKSKYFESFQDSDPGPDSETPLTGQTLPVKGDKLFFYAGEVERVVDGDTLLVDADLGFNVKIELRLRLRGINTAELSAQDQQNQQLAQKAKEFVENKLGGVERIVFQSFKVDLYGRFVADVYYLPGETDREEIVANGNFLNQDLLDAGLATLH